MSFNLKKNIYTKIMDEIFITIFARPSKLGGKFQEKKKTENEEGDKCGHGCGQWGGESRSQPNSQL